MKFYDELENVNNKKFSYCCLKIKWIIPNIVKDRENNGFIVQKVKFVNTTGIEKYEKQIEYYEAWKVKNFKIIEEDENIEEDDCFCISSKYLIFDSIKESLGKVGEFIFESEIFWINKSDKRYFEIDTWKRNGVKMAGKLKSILVEEYDGLYGCIPICKRPDFIHKVNFVDEELIIKTIQQEFAGYIKNKKEEFLEELDENLKNTNYYYIVDKIKDGDLYGIYKKM